MKIKEIIYQTPEMTEEKLLEIMNSHLNLVKENLKNRIIEIHRNDRMPFDLAQLFLDEYDLIQDKKSYLTKSQRDIVTGFVGLCMIKMTKGNERNN